MDDIFWIRLFLSFHPGEFFEYEDGWGNAGEGVMQGEGEEGNPFFFSEQLKHNFEIEEEARICYFYFLHIFVLFLPLFVV